MFITPQEIEMVQNQQDEALLMPYREKINFVLTLLAQQAKGGEFRLYVNDPYEPVNEPVEIRLNHGTDYDQFCNALYRQLRKSGWNCQPRELGEAFLKISTIRANN
jgi:hypothetical protein